MDGTAITDDRNPANSPVKSVTPIENNRGCFAKRRTPVPINVVKAARKTAVTVPVLYP